MWEVSCRQDVKTKLDEDYEKRTCEMSDKERRDRIFVAVSGRRYSKKHKWQRNKYLRKEWKDVCMLDAEDLEQWLEEAPAVSFVVCRGSIESERTRH